MTKYICEFCKKEYECDTSLGNWISTGGQGHQRGSIPSDKYCSYECGWKARSIKSKQKVLEKYGVDNVAKLPETLKKMKDTCQQRYGGRAPACSQKVLEKTKQTNKTKYGKEWGLQSSEVIEKRQNTLQEVYGVSNIFQVQEIKNKAKKTCQEKYGADAFVKSQAYKDLWKDTDKSAQWVTNRFEAQKINGTAFTSRKELELKKFLEDLGIKTEKKRFKKIEIDLFDPTSNIGIEFNGSYWHSMNGPNKKYMTPQYHTNKTKLCEDNGIRLIHIWEDEWDNKQEIVKDLLRSVFKKQSKKIYARQCVIKEIDNVSYKDFCIKHHLQGYRAAKYRYGLFYKDELVQICSFHPCHAPHGKTPTYEYEWIRGCFASNNTVVGGTSKLLNHFIKVVQPQSILCYADRNKFTGESYLKSGFILTGLVKFDKFYIDPNTGRRITRNPKKYKEYMELVKQGKLLLCYGAGSFRFVWLRKEEQNGKED